MALKQKKAKKKAVKRRPLKKKVVKKALKKKPAKKAVKKAVSKKKPAVAKAKKVKENVIGKITHYFPHVNAAVLKIKTGEIRVGDELLFKGHTTDFKQKVVSMEIDHQPVMIAKKGDDFGVEVKSRVRAGDLVFKK